MKDRRFLFVLAVAGAIGVYAITNQPSSSTRATAPPRPAPTPVPFRADQVILPPEQFPIRGFVVRQDQPSDPDGWQRVFGLSDRDDGAIAVAVSIIPTDVVDTRTFFTTLAQRTCALTGKAISARDTGPSSSTIGEADRFCVYGYATGPATLGYRSLVGHYYVEVIEVGSPSVSTAEQISRATTIMALQVAIIRRLAP